VIRILGGVGNLNWGDDDLQTLYVAASTSIYRVQMKVRGTKLDYMRYEGDASTAATVMLRLASSRQPVPRS
jgi:hypothetical protein